MSNYTLVTSIDKQNMGTYYLIKPAHFYVGFCGYLWQVIRGIYKYPNEKYYIYIGNPNGGPNVWDFYFRQPCINTQPPSNEIKAEVGLLFDENSEFVDVYPCMRALTPTQKQERWQKFNNIVTTYFTLQPEIQDKINSFRLENFGNKKVLGFHCRGTDHPDKKSISESFPIIDSKLNEYDIIYSSTDENAIMDALKQRYGHRLVSYNSQTRSDPCDFQMTRSENTDPSHAFRYNAIINWAKDNNGYQIGEDIVVETHLMASTNFLLCACNSNVNYFVRAINSNLPYEIIYTPEL